MSLRFRRTGNLLAMLGSYHAERDWYIGLYWTPRIDMEWKEADKPTHPHSHTPAHPLPLTPSQPLTPPS